MFEAIYCENGHFIASKPEIPDYMIRSGAMDKRFHDELKRLSFCTKCGSPSVCVCPSCNASIVAEDERPSYCGSCGKQYPWTQLALDAAKEYTDELESLSEEDKTKLKETFSDLTVETAKTPLAESRFTKFLVKIGPPAASALTKILGDVMTSEIKRTLGLG